MVEAAELLNDSAYRRTIAGISKSLGEARVSFLLLSGVNPEVVVTVAWDISWYQYRVVFESGQPVRLAERGSVTLQILVLGLVFVVLAVCSDAVWALAAGTASVRLRDSRSYLAVQRYVSGSVFLGLGTVAALAKRH